MSYYNLTNLTIYNKDKTSSQFCWSSIDKNIVKDVVSTEKGNQGNYHYNSDLDVDKYIVTTEKCNQGNPHEYSGSYLDSTQTTAESSLASSRQTSFLNKDEEAKNFSLEFADKFLNSPENNKYFESDDEQKNNCYDFFGFQQQPGEIHEYPHETFNTQDPQTIEMDSLTEAGNILQQNNQKIDCVHLHKTFPVKTKKSYEHKNVLKILGQKLISMIIDNYYESKKKNTLEELLMQIQDDVAREIGRRELFIGSVSDFKEYLKIENIKKKYTKIKTFKEFWRTNEYYQDPKLEVYRRLLAKITRKFLEEDVYHILIQNKGPKPIKKEGKIFGYLQKVPILLRGMNDPEHFTNLDD